MLAAMRASDMAMLVGLAAIWGGSFLCMRLSAPELGIPVLVGFRVLVAGAVLLPLLFVKAADGNGQRWRIALQRLPALALLGLLNSSLPFALLGFTTATLNAGLASIINATVPFFATLIAWVWLGERPGRTQWIGLTVGFAGVAVLVWPKFAASALPSSTPVGTIAVVAVGTGLLAALLYGFSAIYTKKILKGIEPMTVAATGTLCAAVWSVFPAGAMLLGAHTADDPADFAARMRMFGGAPKPLMEVSATAWIAATVLGVVCTAFAYVLFYRLFKTIGPTKAITVTFLIPVFGVLWGAVFLHERLTIYTAVGGTMILVGMSLVTGLIKNLMGRATAARP